LEFATDTTFIKAPHFVMYIQQYLENKYGDDFLKEKGNNFIPLVVKGNHGFGIKNPDGQLNAELGAKNLKSISKWIFTWLK
jgi:hypothetical protein